MSRSELPARAFRDLTKYDHTNGRFLRLPKSVVSNCIMVMFRRIWTIFDKLKFILGSEAWGNKTKEMYYSLLSLKMISFDLYPRAS